MGLAPVLVDSIFETIRQLHADGTTILLVEQNARMALQVVRRGTYCNRVLWCSAIQRKIYIKMNWFAKPTLVRPRSIYD